MRYPTDDQRILNIQEVIPPEDLLREFPLSEETARTVYQARESIHRILSGEDDRAVVITGPCSIHDPEAAREYAERLKGIHDEVSDALLLVMRVYFEKPRSTVGWKGLINDPYLDGSFQINEGLRLARGLLRDLAEAGIPAGTEFLDLISPQYVADLVSWGAIGARTTESQVHRELASGLSCPVGFKNATDGGIQVAVDAIRSSARPHHFLSLTKEGRSAIFSTAGNPDCHVILRGGRKPNYDADSIARTAAMLEKAGLIPRVMVDCSHANSGKDPQRQFDVGRALAATLASGETRVFGLMLESNLIGGRQDVLADSLTYGQSITDACMGWDESADLLRNLADGVRQRRQARDTKTA